MLMSDVAVPAGPVPTPPGPGRGEGLSQAPLPALAFLARGGVTPVSAMVPQVALLLVKTAAPLVEGPAYSMVTSC